MQIVKRWVCRDLCHRVTISGSLGQKLWKAAPISRMSAILKDLKIFSFGWETRVELARCLRSNMVLVIGSGSLLNDSNIVHVEVTKPNFRLSCSLDNRPHS